MNKEERAAKKEAKKAAKKEKYASLDRKGQVKHWAKRIIAVVVILVVAATAGFYTTVNIRMWSVQKRYERSLDKQATEEELLQKVKPDEEGAKKIAQMEQYSPDDTWAIYVYMCGSNLESWDIDEMSDIAKYMVYENAEEIYAENVAKRHENITEFVEEIREKGMDLPDFMYLPQKGNDDEDTEEEEYDEYPGAATADLDEMFAVDLPANIKVVFQFGGATRWDKAGINPNRTQRFVYDSEEFREVDNTPLQDMGDPDTLADFLSFCKKEYPADHKIMLFWDHGGGAFGFGSDDIFGGDGLSLKETREAFSKVYKADSNNPPFDIIGYDACLMASVEVADSLNGYGRYLAASEELENGEGWNHTAWLGELAAHPEMNAAQVGKEMVDSYVEYYANQSIQLEWYGVDNMCTFSLVDISKAHQVYEAYSKFAAAALKDAVKSEDVMASLGRATNKSVRYGMYVYKTYNTVDLGLFMENMAEDYPNETKAVLTALDNAVIYNRATSYGEDSMGLSVYFPTDIEDFSGLAKYISYINDICDNKDIAALYYYKFAGCFNDEFQAYADEKGYGKAKILDTSALKKLSSADVKVEGDGRFSLVLDNVQKDMVQDIGLDIFRMDEDNEKAIYYGEDSQLNLDDEGKLETTFNGKWIMFGGQPLSVEKIDESNNTITYRAPVSYNDVDSYLTILYDMEKNDMSILGVIKMNEETEADTMNRNTKNVESGAKIRPIYYTNDYNSDGFETEYGKKFSYTSKTRAEYKSLDDGDYIEFVTFKDSRGDVYYSPVVNFTVRGGKVTDAQLSQEWQIIESAD